MAGPMLPSRRPDDRVIVIGASAGGLHPLQQLLAGLPADLPAAIFIATHMGADSRLTSILAGASPLPVVPAVQGLAIVPGRIYVAVPDVHLLMQDAHVLLSRGPQENMARPAIDPLFRSAACTFGPRVIGVVLSGMLDDGAAGLWAIHRCGGRTVVQTPSDAAFPEMPRSALRCGAIDHTRPARELGHLLARLVQEPVGPAHPVPPDVILQAAIAALHPVGRPLGPASAAHTMAHTQAARTEETLRILMRTHHQRGALARRMAGQEQAAGRSVLADRLRKRACRYDEDAETCRRLLRARDATATGQDAA